MKQADASKLSRRDFLATATACVTAAGMMGAGCMEPNQRAAKTLGVCGLDCAACPAFIARKTDDQALREKTAAEWSQQFQVEFKPEDINCVGCLKVEGSHIGHCSECEIRTCGLGRKVDNCALCSDYPCETIAGFLAKVPPAKANLDEVQRAGEN
ncbi:MAG: DUF3795 domain-containing protein [Sedimentisphaerales bacterium]|nr:DUF3795 domain-containing protein [Sedimentisphaerales bacterium]